jgi:hypothetical protein
MEQGRIVCCECLAVADERAQGWRAYRADVPGEDPAPILAFYCKPCAELVFGAPSSHREVRQLIRTLRSAADAAAEAGPDGTTHALGRYLRKRFAR